MSINLVIADDEPLAHGQAAKVLPSSRCSTWRLVATSVTKPEAAFQRWIIETASLAGDVALVLDLGFRGTAEDLWASVRLVVDGLPKDSAIRQVPDNRWDGLAAAISIINAQQIERLLILVASGGPGPRELREIGRCLREEIERLQKSTTHKVEFAHSTLVDSPDDAKYVLDVLADYWVKHFELHDHPFTSEVLKTFLSPWTEKLNCPERKWSWCHECLDSVSTPFFEKLTRLLPLLPKTRNPTQAAKSLLMLSADVGTMETAWEKVWSGFNDGQETRPLSGVVLKQILSKLGVANHGISDEQCWKMPIAPSMPFLVSCAQLVRKFEAGETTPFVTWHWGSGQFCFYLQTGKTRKKDGLVQAVGPRDLENTYRKKLASNSLSGVCEALHNLLFCRLGGLNETMPMLAVFGGKGLEKPVVDLQFGDYSFQLSWPRRK